MKTVSRPMKWFIPLKFKFFIIFLILITIPFLISGFVTYSKYSDNVEANVTELGNSVTRQMANNLDRYIQEIDRLTRSTYYDGEIMKVLDKIQEQERAGGYSFLVTSERQKMNSFLSSLAFDRQEIKGIMILASDLSIFSSFDNQPLLDRPDWIDTVEKSEGELIVLPPHAAEYYLHKNLSQQVISFARMIRAPGTKHPLGLIMVDVAYEDFESILSETAIVPDSIVIVSDEEGAAIYSNTAEPRAMPDRNADESSLKQRYLISSLHSYDTGITVTGYIPKEGFLKEARELTRFTFYISLFSLGCAYLVSLLMSIHLVKPIRHLRMKMRRVEKGSFQERASVANMDELGQLAHGFNHMVEQIDKLVKEVYEVKLRERDAELSVLRSQMNPHFIYNTLESVNSLARKKENNRIIEVVTNFGKLLRYTMDKEEQPVRLRDELLFMDAYLNIQSYRIGKQLVIDYAIDATYEDCLVPKMIVQPFIENIIEHANVREILIIRIAAAIESDNLVVSIEDNGAGISADRREEIMRNINPHTRSLPVRAGGDRFGELRKGYALYNVNQRLKLLYGDEYGVEIDSEKTDGAGFTIKLPFLWGNGDV